MRQIDGMLILGAFIPPVLFDHPDLNVAIPSSCWLAAADISVR